MDDLRWRSGWILLVVLVHNGVNLAECRPVESKEGDSFASAGLLTKDTKLTHNLVLGLLVTAATLISLMIALMLCACDSMPERNDQIEVATDNGEVAVVDDGVPASPSPDALTAPVPDPALAVPADSAPKMRTASASSNNPGHSDDPLIRCSTIDRRLPELPPTPMPPVTPTNEDEEDDYNRTYDVIGETKTNAGATKDDKKQESFPEDEVEDEQYASVSDSAAGKQNRGVKAEPTADADYNSISVTNSGVGNAEEGDEPYAVVVVPGAEAKDVENANYASVGTDKEEKEGYSRLRSIQKRTREESPEGGEKNGYARLRDIAVDGSTASGAVGGAMGGAMGGAVVKEEDEEVPPVPYKPPDLQNEDEENSPIPRTPSVGTAAGATVNGITVNIDGNAPATKKKEPPYTQVSARESLEVVRARQQAEQSARQAAHYQTIEEDQNLDADHDGIYEPVDDQQLDGQMVLSPPPLPGDRQGTTNGPSASNNWQMTRAPRVYEEITDETRPRPPNMLAAAANAQAENDDDIEPYAVTEKRPNPADIPTYSVVDKKSKVHYAKVNKAATNPDQANNNARTEVRSPDPGSSSPVPTDEAGLPLYAVVEKKGRSKESETKEDAAEYAWDDLTASTKPQEDAYQAVEDNYQTVGDMPGTNGDLSAAAVAGGMVHVSQRDPPNDLWTKKEHMYIDVETNQPSTPPAGAEQRSPAGPRTNHSYESVEVVPKPANKKEKQKQAKKEAKQAKKEAKRERKHSKGSKGAKEKDKEGEAKGAAGEDTVWQRQESPEANGNSNNNTDPSDDYENVAFPLQETRL
ncbi:uncharacterized protein LOC119735745 [Patiria miniata]|uniref:Uncharacterized protein n=1 Tax=Patiria miniata TaxID=46514 RepID=A0A914AQ75_PATMI|nr:uncharacterized protein LOC119735745 [Patiria miniata]